MSENFSIVEKLQKCVRKLNYFNKIKTLRSGGMTFKGLALALNFTTTTYNSLRKHVLSHMYVCLVRRQYLIAFALSQYKSVLSVN